MSTELASLSTSAELSSSKAAPVELDAEEAAHRRRVVRNGRLLICVLALLAVNAALVGAQVATLTKLHAEATAAREQFARPLKFATAALNSLADLSDSVTQLFGGSVAALVNRLADSDFSALGGNVTNITHSVAAATCEMVAAPPSSCAPTPANLCCGIDSFTWYNSPSWWNSPWGICMNSTMSTFGGNMYSYQSACCEPTDARYVISKVFSMIESVAKRVRQVGAPASLTPYDPADINGGLLLNFVNYLQDFVIGQTHSQEYRSLAVRCSDIVNRMRAVTWSGNYSGTCSASVTYKRSWDITYNMNDFLTNTLQPICSTLASLGP